MQTPIDYPRLIDALLRKTRDGRLRWRESNRLGQFVAEVGGYGVGVSLFEFLEHFGDHARAPIDFQFLTDRGLEFRRERIDPDDRHYPAARSLYDLAAKNALSKADMARELLEQAVA